MGTIKIEIPGRADRTFRIDSSGSAETVFKEIKTLLKQKSKSASAINGSAKIANERIARARRHLKGLEKKKASREALQISDEIRKSWIRKNV